MQALDLPALPFGLPGLTEVQTWELNPAFRLMRPGRAPAHLQAFRVVTVGFEPTLSTF